MTAILPLSDYMDDHYVFMATAMGTVKRVALEQFSRPRSVGLIALGLVEGDSLVSARITTGEQDVMLFATNGKAIRFSETDVRAVGRTAQGVRGIKMGDDDEVVSLVVVDDPDQNEVLIACANGFGKRTMVSEFRQIGRGGQGVIAINASERNGPLVRAIKVEEGYDVILITDAGTLVRTGVDQIAQAGRNAQGVTLIRTAVGEHLVGLASVEAEGEEELGELDDDQLVDDTTDTDAADSEQTPRPS